MMGQVAIHSMGLDKFRLKLFSLPGRSKSSMALENALKTPRKRPIDVDFDASGASKRIRNHVEEVA